MESEYYCKSAEMFLNVSYNDVHREISHTLLKTK